jgi:hypothetical protein
MFQSAEFFIPRNTLQNSPALPDDEELVSRIRQTFNLTTQSGEYSSPSHDGTQLIYN